MNSGRVFLVGCSSQKMITSKDPRHPDHKVPASRLYTSALFKKSFQLAERCDGQTFVLSAFYGLVSARMKLQTYDYTIARFAGFQGRLTWAKACLHHLKHAWKYTKRTELVIFAGEAYAAPIVEAAKAYGWTTVQPLAKMQIGQRLSFLKRELAKTEEHTR